MICNLVIRDGNERPTRTWVIPFEFDADNFNIDPEAAIRAAVQDFLRSPESETAQEYANGSFNWGDAMSSVPNEFFERRGLHPASATSIDIEVEHDEVLSLDNEDEEVSK